MTEDGVWLLAAGRDRYLAAFVFVNASVARTTTFDAKKEYSPTERESFDALSDRFVRAVETGVQFLRSYERFVQGAVSPTLRDTLHAMEKVNLVTDTEQWIDMREVRNRVVHEYSAEELEKLYADIRASFFEELTNLAAILPGLTFDG